MAFNNSLYKVNIDKVINKGKLRGFCTLTIASEVVIHNIAIFEGDNGECFFRMPQREYEVDGEKKYFDIAAPITAIARESITKAILTAYSKATDNQ